MSSVNSPLHHRASSAIERHPHLKAHRVCIETEEGRVTLRGVVNSYYQKQMAQEALRRLEGVHHIDNHLEVNWL